MAIGRRGLITALGLSIAPGWAYGQTTRPPWRTRLSDLSTRALSDVQNGLPLVSIVIVPLCANPQIACGGGGAGDPRSHSRNLYWGAVFGARTMFDSSRQWKAAGSATANGPLLEVKVYERSLPARNWPNANGTVRHVVILCAVNGESIDLAVQWFWQLATEGKPPDALSSVNALNPNTGTLRPHIVGYAGHNRLMDGLRLPRAPKSNANAIPSFVLACRSEAYFGDRLRAAGSTPLLMTRDLVAPEGYVLRSIATSLSTNSTLTMLRARAVGEYARFQRISEQRAGLIFTHPQT